MTVGWTFHNPVAVKFGAGCALVGVGKLPYRRMLLVTTAGMTRRGAVQGLREVCNGAIAAVHDGVVPNPEMSVLDALAVRYRSGGFDALVALGGGSALDTAKILNVLLSAPTTFTLRAHFIEGKPIPEAPALPVIAIPTTAGTGSEVTPFATVWDASAGRKYSLAHPRMFPALALLDPDLTRDLPWEVTLATGLDALCQAFESIWNRNANPITVGFAMRSVRLAWPALQEGRALMASPMLRAELMEASLLAGLAISHTRTALCHSMSYPITARFGLPHGLACAFTMPAVLRLNAAADDGRLAALAAQQGFASMPQFAAALESLLTTCGLDGFLAAYGLTAERVRALVPEMYHPDRADNNLRPAGLDDIRVVLAGAATHLPALR